VQAARSQTRETSVSGGSTCRSLNRPASGPHNRTMKRRNVIISVAIGMSIAAIPYLVATLGYAISSLIFIVVVKGTYLILALGSSAKNSGTHLHSSADVLLLGKLIHDVPEAGGSDADTGGD